MGIEPATSSLPRKCSTSELQQRAIFTVPFCKKRNTTVLFHVNRCLFPSDFQSGRRDSNPRPSAWKANALSTELLPQNFNKIRKRISVLSWAVMDSNHRSRKTAELQSAPFGHSGNCPILFSNSQFGLPKFITLSVRASCRIRTNDPEITNHVLWPAELKRQLSKKHHFRV